MTSKPGPVKVQAVHETIVATPFHCILHGLKDALNIYQPIKCLYGSEEVWRETRNCFLVNGVIFLGSQVLFHSFVRPSVFWLLHILFSINDTLSSYGDSPIWFVDVTLAALYNVLWVYPFYLASKVINSLLYQDIADGAYLYLRGKRQRQPRDDNGLIAYLISSLADVLFTTILEFLLLLQTSLLSYVPTFGPALGLIYTSWMCSLWCFEYTWINAGWDLARRLEYFERHWAYFLGFGIPFTIATSSLSFMTSSAVFGICFPWFIITAVASNPVSFGESFIGLVPERVGVCTQSRGLAGYIMKLLQPKKSAQ